MNFKVSAGRSCWCCLGVGCGMAQVSVPDTPAGQTLQKWLDAFNSGDRAKIETYIKTVDPAQAVDGMMAFRQTRAGLNYYRSKAASRSIFAFG